MSEALKHPLFLDHRWNVAGLSRLLCDPGLATTHGLPTNAVYGFAIMLKRVLEKYPPDYICVALDSPEPTARHAQYDLYKATRKKMPSDLAQQMPYLRKFCQAMRIPVLAIPGQEADDIIATVAPNALEAGSVSSHCDVSIKTYTSLSTTS